MRKVIEDYCRHLECSGKSSLTVSSYRQDLVNLERWVEGTLGEGASWRDLTPVDLKEYRRHLQERRRPSTVNKAVVVIKAFFTWAEEQGLVKYNPTLEM